MSSRGFALVGLRRKTLLETATDLVIPCLRVLSAHLAVVLFVGRCCCHSAVAARTSAWIVGGHSLSIPSTKCLTALFPLC